MATGTKHAPSHSYLALVQEHPLTSLKNDRHLAAAQRIIDALLKRHLDRGEEQYLDALSDLVIAYEEKHFPIRPPSDAALLRFLLEANSLSQAELADGTGMSRSVVCEILSGQRNQQRRDAEASSVLPSSAGCICPRSYEPMK